MQKEENIVQLYHLSCESTISYPINFMLYMYVVSIKNEFDINVLTRNYLCSCPTDQSYKIQYNKYEI